MISEYVGKDGYEEDGGCWRGLKGLGDKNKCKWVFGSRILDEFEVNLRGLDEIFIWLSMSKKFEFLEDFEMRLD